MEAKAKKRRYVLLLSIVVCAAALLAARLVQWQVFQSEMYSHIAEVRNTYTVKGDAIRGEIFDINGEPLSVNLVGYKIVMNKLLIREEEQNEIIARLITLTEECGVKWIDELPIQRSSTKQYCFDKDREGEIRILKSREYLNMNPYASAEECMIKLTERYECERYPVEMQRKIASVRYRMERTGYSKTQPYVFAKELDEDSMMVISERMTGTKGVTVEAMAVRTYCNGDLAPHLVGVTGLISAQEYEEYREKGYGYTDYIGKSGVEAAFEDQLRGTAGSLTYEEDDQGRAELVSAEKTVPGNSVYLTIDAKLQRTAENALKEAVLQANEYAKECGDPQMGADCVGAAAVVLRVKDFSVMCAANYPNYDLSTFYEDYETLVSDKTLPLFDRAFMGALAPGSTYKPLVACAALQEKKISAHTSIHCDGVYTTGGQRLWCMGFHGQQDLEHALMNSCNVFFAETGRLLGIDLLDRYAKRCGLGVKTGVEVQESAGTLAGPDLSEQMGSQWYESFVSPAAIGQSDNQFTPLQLAVYAATLANNGVRLKAHIADRVVKYASDEVLMQSESEIVDELGVSPQYLKTVQSGMLLAASHYTLLEDYPVKVAGKTGTAENNGSDHANFICYAPFDHPQIAVAVMVEHGAKSAVAIGAAKKIMDAYFGLDTEKQP